VPLKGLSMKMAVFPASRPQLRLWPLLTVPVPVFIALMSRLFAWDGRHSRVRHSRPWARHVSEGRNHQSIVDITRAYS
jgi:hypothetical protein